MKSVQLMSHCKIVHAGLVLYIQKNFASTFKTVYIYVFCLFVLKIAAKIDHVFVLGVYIRNLI